MAGVTMCNGYRCTTWPRCKSSESYAAPFSVKITEIYEFFVTMGIMSELLGYCVWSTIGLRANDRSKPRIAPVLTSSLALSHGVIHRQYPHRSVIIPYLKHKEQSLVKSWSTCEILVEEDVFKTPWWLFCLGVSVNYFGCTLYDPIR